jgi:uncharacterized protein YndB with AHSA1/START domain
LPVIRRCWSLRGVRVHAPYATKYQWGYLHEAMEVDGDNRMELLLTPSVDQDSRRVTFTHGGWFDAAAAKPAIEVQREKAGPWVKIGDMEDYPATTMTDRAGLDPRTVFTCTLAAPETVVAVRVTGVPARSKTKGRHVLVGAELQAFTR